VCTSLVRKGSKNAAVLKSQCPRLCTLVLSNALLRIWNTVVMLAFMQLPLERLDDPSAFFNDGIVDRLGEHSAFFPHLYINSIVGIFL
jgi:hypothetical protein